MLYPCIVSSKQFQILFYLLKTLISKISMHLSIYSQCRGLSQHTAIAVLRPKLENLRTRKTRHGNHTGSGTRFAQRCSHIRHRNQSRLRQLLAGNSGRPNTLSDRCQHRRRLSQRNADWSGRRNVQHLCHRFRWST